MDKEEIYFLIEKEFGENLSNENSVSVDYYIKLFKLGMKQSQSKKLKAKDEEIERLSEFEHKFITADEYCEELVKELKKYKALNKELEGKLISKQMFLKENTNLKEREKELEECLTQHHDMRLLLAITKEISYGETTRDRTEHLLNKTESSVSEGMIKCSECGEYFKKKEIIIQGDIDTCDDCLCPE